VHTLGGHNPKANAKARPTLGLPQQAYEPAHVAIRYGCFGRDECLPGLVVYTNCAVLVVIRHRPTSVFGSWSNAFLLDHFPTTPPNDNEQYDYR
jgi:hypothetical protein